MQPSTNNALSASLFSNTIEGGRSVACTPKRTEHRESVAMLILVLNAIPLLLVPIGEMAVRMTQVFSRRRS